MRFRRSGISVMLLIESSMLNEPTRNHFGLAARFLYLREGGFREQMRGNMQRRLQLSVSQNLEPVAEPLDETALEQKGRRDRLFRLEPFKVAQVNYSILLPEDVCKTSLGKTPMQGHLAAFEAGPLAGTGSRTLPLGAARRGFSVSRTPAAPDPLAALVSSSRRTKCSDVRRHLLPLFLLLPFLRRASRFRTEAGRLPLGDLCNLALRRRAALRRLLPSLRGRRGNLLRRFFRRLGCS